jgi:hypothetical protein
MLVNSLLFFYYHPDISNLLNIDSMIESPQNDYAPMINWKRRLKRKPNRCCLEKAVSANGNTGHFDYL